MKTSSIRVSVLGLCLCAGVAQNPVPTRVGVELYGEASGYPNPLSAALHLDVAARGGPRLLLDGGQPDAIAVIAFGLRKAALAMPQGTTLFVEPLAVAAGNFDANGEFALALDVTDPAFVGAKVYAQGLHYVPVLLPQAPARTVEYFQMTRGVGVGFVAGNPQPALSYRGPRLRATPIATRDGAVTTHAVLAQIDVPSGGYALQLAGVDHDSGVTRIFLVLEAPAPSEVVTPESETRRLVVDLAAASLPSIEVQIEQRVRGSIGMPAFALAAVVERDY